MRNALALIALAALAACAPIQTQTTATIPPKDPNAITLAATVVTSSWTLTASDVTIRINGEPIIKGDWQSSNLQGSWRDRRAWAKCHSRLNLLRNIGSEVYCDVYLDESRVGTVSATEE